MKKFLLIFLISLGFPFVSSGEKIKVAYITILPVNNSSDEIKAAYAEFLKDSTIHIENVLFRDILKQVDKKKYDLIWIHDDENLPEDFLSKKNIEKLKEKINQGGKIFLSLQAFKLIVPVCGEKQIPKDSLKPCIDDGYGRRLGIHSFISHPVFSGMFGGAYLLRPLKDTSVKICGFFGDVIPSGKVIGIDWDYIFLREQSKLLLEYRIGKGCVIACGGYLNFSIPNSNHEHLMLFCRNLFTFLKNDTCGKDCHFWDYSEPQITECSITPTDRLIVKPPDSREWKIENSDIDLHKINASDNFWDVAGERILTMGNEKSGIEEVWAHPFMAFRDYEVGIKFAYKDTIYWLKDERPEITVKPSSFIRNYKFQRGYLKEVIVNDPAEPAGVVHYEYDGVYEAKLVIKFRSDLRLMWPYSEKTTGSLCSGYSGDYDAILISSANGLSTVMLGANRSPETHKEGKAGNGDGVEGMFTYPLKMADKFDFIYAAGQGGENEVSDLFRKVASDPYAVYLNSENHYRKLFSNSLSILTPDENFNKGYKWSVAATDKFLVNTPGMGKSLVAGYGTTSKGWDGGHKINGRPGYSWYFGRDGEWSGFALLDYGDFDRVKDILEFYDRYQDLSGKIFHEATTSGVIHYDAADATPLYIILWGKYFRHTNDTTFLRSHWKGIKKAIDFCFSTDTDHNHLIENTNVGHGWVEGGELYGSHETIYMAGCWSAALDEAFVMASAVGDQSAGLYNQEANTVKDVISEKFINPQNHTLYYGINKNGAPRTESTILPAVPVYFGAVEKEAAVPILRQYASNAFTTNWGTRIIREDSKLFKPYGYHYGSVWPLFTGWASLAEYRCGKAVQGFSHILNNLNIYKNWGLGYAEEVLNGAEYKPSGVCAHQCWSETMIIQPSVEGMLGFEPFSAENRISMYPSFPAQWDSVSVKHLKVDNRDLNFSMIRSGKTISWHFTLTGNNLTLNFAPHLPSGTKITGARLNGKPFQLITITLPGFVIVSGKLNLTGDDILEMDYEKGISVIPVIEDPKPGDKAEGLRIIDYGLKGNEYFTETEAPAGNEEIISFYCNAPVDKVTGGTIIRNENNKLDIKLLFEKSDQKYLRKRVSITLK